MFEDLQQKLIAMLAAALHPEAVYGARPQDAPVPFTLVGEPSSDRADTDDSIGRLVKTRVRFVRKAGDIAGSLARADLVAAVLHHTEMLTLDAGTVVTVYVDGVDSDPLVDDGKTRETEVTVAVLVDDITPGTD